MSLGSALRFVVSLIVPIAFSVAAGLVVAFFLTPAFLLGVATFVWLAFTIVRERWVEGADGIRKRIRDAEANGVPLYAFVLFHVWIVGLALFSALAVVRWLFAEDESYSIITSIGHDVEALFVLNLLLLVALLGPPIDRSIRRMWIRRDRP
jgi:hypothetical protein